MAASISKGSVKWWAVLAFDPLPIGGIAVALLLGTNALLHVSVSLPLLVSGFCGVSLIYLADRAAVPSPEDATNHPERRRWVRSHRGWLVVEAGLLMVAGGRGLAVLRPETLLAATGLVGLAGLHLLPVGDMGRPLKSLRIAKPIVVAGTWAVGATLLPVLEAGQPLTPATWALMGYRLVFILPNVILADWADRRGDRDVGISSWVGALTGRRVRWGATGLLCLAIGGAIAVSTMAQRPLLLWVDAGGAVLLLAAVWTLAPDHPRDRLVLDVLVAWPFVTALVAWGIGVFE